MVVRVGAVSAADVRRWARHSAELLAAARERLDAANLFPVPDHDTGTNLALTARAAADALDGPPASSGSADPDGPAGRNGPAALDAPDAPDAPNARDATDAPDRHPGADGDVAAALRQLATAAVRAARGNSGVILSQVLRGFADAAGPAGLDLPAALHAADTAARAAVADPVEGTMLTVARAAAAVDPVGDDAALAASAARAARAALAGPAPAGAVVDAGAEGLVLVYEALAAVLDTSAAGADPTGLGDRVALATATAPVDPTRLAPHAGTPGGPAYEVQYLLDLPPGADTATAVDRLATTLGPLGDSLVLADDGAGLWAVHVHVDDVGAAVEAGAVAVAHGGAMSQVRVTRFADAPPVPAVTATTPAAGAGGAVGGRPVAVVATGADLAAARTLFTGLAVHVLGPGDAFPAGELVVVTVGPAATTAAMRHADGAAGVNVVPTRAVVQALAAVAVHDPARRGVDDTVAMAEAAGGCRHATLAVAETGGLTIVGVAQAGDVLGLVGDEIAVVGTGHPEVGRRLLDRLLAPGGELVTLLHRTDSAALAADLVAHVRELGDHLDVEVRDLGPDLDSPVLIGVE